MTTMGLRTMDYDDAYGREGLYRSRHGMVAGVCAGIAEHFDFSVFWTRVIVGSVILCSGFWPGVVVYGVAALVMKRDPYVRY